MILRPSPIITFLSKNVGRQQCKASQEQVLPVSFCLHRCLNTLSRSQSPQGNLFKGSSGQTRSITWSRLLANAEKIKSEPGDTLVVKGTPSQDNQVKGTSQESVSPSKESEPSKLSKTLSKETGEPSESATAAANDTVESDGTERGDGKKNLSEKLKNTVAKALGTKPKAVRVDRTKSSVERNYITPVRAMSDFVLKPSDLEGLSMTKRRSPYENEPPITVYWRKDVEARALKVWGSRGNLLNELVKRDMENKHYKNQIFSIKRQLRDYLRSEQNISKDQKTREEFGLMGSSGKVVLTAVIINFSNFAFKFIAWLYTGSHSMFAECVHSLADTINQLILAYGIYKSEQGADVDHPYGYSNMRYVASLISGVGIFCVGTGLNFYHGVSGLLNPTEVENLYWAYYLLGGSLVSEGATLMMAVNAVRKGALSRNMSFTEYITRAQDPSINVVLLEDMAAVVGVIVCGSCMGLTSYFNSHIPDAAGSLIVGGILGAVASFIIYTNVGGLVGRSIPHHQLEKINAELEEDVMVRAIYDVKGIDMGNFLVRYKAEVDFDGRELTRSYLDKQDLQAMLAEASSFKNIDELEAFMVKHGENIVDMMGGEIDRIELKLRKKHPEIRHCDLEIL